MLFNSLQFILFFALVYSVYLLIQKKLVLRNSFLLLSSYIFYAAWDVRFLSLLILSTAVDFIIGNQIGKLPLNSSRRKPLLYVSLGVNLGMLGVFKYFDFFSSSFALLVHSLGYETSPILLHWVLPVGISFYTFQTLSYTLDVYTGSLKPTKNLLNFSLFVSFFPQLVAGPIERARDLLPQIAEIRPITKQRIREGLFLILYGYLLKVVLADNLAKWVNPVFDDPSLFAPIDRILAGVAFTFQIYGDFSGYSKIARGTAKLMGFDLRLNFSTPFFSRNPVEFWDRWHMSLSSWFKEYLYSPLGLHYMRKGNTFLNRYKAHFISMALIGLWHGASFNFVFFGVFWGICIVVYHAGRSKVKIAKPLGISINLILVWFGFLLFRSPSLTHLSSFIGNMGLTGGAQTESIVRQLIFFVLPLILFEILQVLKNDSYFLIRLPWYQKTPVYLMGILWLVLFGVRDEVQFIYFQF